MTTIEKIEKVLEIVVAFFNTILWDKSTLLFLLLGTGVYYTILLGFVQVRKFPTGVKNMFSGFSLHGKKYKDGLSSFQALTTAIAAQVGTGNIAGAATAIYQGGAGAIFWMHVSAFLGMATIFGEAVLAQKTRKLVDGHYVGGPVYYINHIFKGKFAKALSSFFCITIILALGFMGNMVQSNSIAISFVTAFGGEKILVGVVVAIISAFIFLGGIKRIATITEKVVPIMALFYIIGCTIIVIKFHNNLIPAIKSIYVMAFNSSAMWGGAMGITVQKAMRYGVARGLFSNEAGMGSTPHAHATANVKNPSEQGMIAIVGVFIDTFIILTLTALVILTTGAIESGKTGSELAQYAFVQGFGNFGNGFIAICMFFFAFTTIIGWYYFGEVNFRYLFKGKAIKLYSLLAVICVGFGSVLSGGLVWNMADMFNGFMVIPNIIALAFAGKLVKETMLEDEEEDREEIKKH